MTDRSAKCTLLVTGATGFLGTSVVRQLTRTSCRVRATGRRLRPLSVLPNYRPADICDHSAVLRLVAGADIVIHAAGLAHQYPQANSAAEGFFRTNVTGTESVVRSAAVAGCRRVVLVSSVAVYGNGWPPKTEAAACEPVGPYARSKWEAEQIACDIADTAGLELIILRLATLYGENDPGNVGRLLRAIDRGRFVWIGQGDNQKTLLHVEDAAHACVAAALQQHLPPERTHNVADQPYLMRTIVLELAAALGSRIPSVHFPAAMARSMASMAGRIPFLGGRARRFRMTVEKWLSDEAYDASRFRDAFDWRARISFEEGVRSQVASYRNCASSAA